MSQSVMAHATAVAIGGRAVLLRGPSGSGKSDLGLRLIDAGASLVADDQCQLSRVGDRIVVRPPVAIVGLPNFISHIRSGAVKALAIDSETRSALFPDVPTLGELGFPNLAPVYFAFVAPAGTPPAIIARLHDEIAVIGNEPDFRKARLTDIGIVPVFDTPEHLARYLEEQRTNGAKLIRESGFQPR